MGRTHTDYIWIKVIECPEINMRKILPRIFRYLVSGIDKGIIIRMKGNKQIHVVIF